MEAGYRKSVQILWERIGELEQAIEKAKNTWGELTGTAVDLEEAQRELRAFKNRLETVR